MTELNFEESIIQFRKKSFSYVNSINIDKENLNDFCKISKCKVKKERGKFIIHSKFPMIYTDKIYNFVYSNSLIYEEYDLLYTEYTGFHKIEWYFKKFPSYILYHRKKYNYLSRRETIIENEYLSSFLDENNYINLNNRLDPIIIGGIWIALEEGLL